MKKLLRFAATVATGASLMTGIAAASTGTIGTTGPDSTNRIVFRNTTSHSVQNNNNVNVASMNPQFAMTGNATVRHNTTAGSAMSGDAANDSLTRATVTLNNSGAGAGMGMGAQSNTASVTNTGPDSKNVVKFEDSHVMTVQNNNNLNVMNMNSQVAGTGNAKVSDNTTGGNAVSGNASNVSTNEFVLTITN